MQTSAFLVELFAGRRSAPAVTLLLFLAVLLASASTACLGDTIYNLADYGQNGVKIEGTITTDVDSGLLTDGDIKSFNITITPASGDAFTLTPSDSVYVYCNSLNADPSSLYLTPGFGSYFHLWSDNGWVANLDYEDYYGPPSQASDFLLVHDLSNNPLFSVAADTGLIGCDPMIIATVVPEPATLVLLGMGAMGLAFLQLVRTRKKAGSSAMA